MNSTAHTTAIKLELEKPPEGVSGKSPALGIGMQGVGEVMRLDHLRRALTGGYHVTVERV